MPVPHEVTKEFFIPTEDEQFFGNGNQTGAQPIEERIGDLLFLFNLIDAALGRNAPDDIPMQHAHDENAENDEDEENGENGENDMYDEETEHMDEDIREVPIHETETDEQPADDNHEEGQEDEQEGEEGHGNAHLTRHVIRLDEFDLLALPLLLMRSRIRTNEEGPGRQQERSQTPNENEQDGSVDPLLRIFSRAFGPRQ